MDTRRLFLTFALCFAVVIAWSYFFPPPKADQAAAPQETAAPSESPSSEAPSRRPGGPSGAEEEATAAPALPAAPEVFGKAEERVVLETDHLRAVFTNRGAQLLSVELKGDKTAGGEKMDLVRARAGAPYPYALTDGSLRSHPLNDAMFSVERAPDGSSVVFSYRGPRGIAEKRFSFAEKGLLAATIRVPGRNDWGVLFGPGIRNPTPEELANRFERRTAVYKTSDEVHVVDPKGTKEAIELPGRSLRWIGLEDTYFLSAQIPQGGVARAVLQPLLIESVGDDGATRFAPVPPEDELTADQKDMNREIRVVLEAGSGEMSLLSYWGSKRLEQLSALPYGLDETVQLGRLSLIARPLLAALHWIHRNVVANYGWAIILLTVVIKILLLPLTHHSTVSMRKMQKLNPQIQAIRDRYRTKLKDKQGRPNLEAQRKMNEEVMGLYKTQGVNPAGGCLPLLLQMPILFAFYRLLTTAVELRGEPWMLWIADLAAKDPYYVLPVVMGLTQFLQVLLSPQVGDPIQRRLFLFMPLFMTIFFLGFPSGLVLYWLTNNVLTIVQQGVYNRLQRNEA